MKEYLRNLHETYKKTIGAFADAYPQCNEKTIVSIDNYCRACAIFLWTKLNSDASKCTKAINEIYSDGQNSPKLSDANISAAMSKVSEKESMPVPDFFKEIIAYDVANKEDFSRRLAYCFELLGISFALIDGNVEKKEAEMISMMQKCLIDECDASNVKASMNDLNPFDYVSDNKKEKLFVTADKPGESSDAKPQKKDENSEKVTSRSKKTQKSSDDADPVKKLNAMIGLSRTKEEVQEIVDLARIQKARRDNGLPVSAVSYHLVFTGKPGTGKTTVARLIAEIYKELGIVSNGELIECSAKDLVAGYVGQTAIKTGEVIEKAIGNVLFIDEAYTLVDKSGQGFGQEAIDTLLKEMEDHRDDLAVIVAGYDDLMKGFIESNPGLKSRFNRFVHFDDYNPDEMLEIFKQLCDKNAYVLDEEIPDLLRGYFDKLHIEDEEGFANARTVRNTFESVISKQASRIAKEKNHTKEILSKIEKEDVLACIDVEEETESLEDIMAEFNSLIGLEMVKEEISDLIFIVQNQQKRKAKGLKVPSLSLHLVFMGSPGTGKTTVARSVAKIYKALGLLSKGQLIETDRSGLVAGYVGQTAIKTQEVIDRAIGGILFIDEAYTLANGTENDFGQEAIDTLLKAMEDKREDLVVIVAGYEDQMDAFIHSNPGLESRFNRYIDFEDYTPDQLLAIFTSLCDKNQYKLDENADSILRDYLESVNAAEIGNGRGVRNIFERVVTQQAKRTELDGDPNVDLSLITEEDISNALERG